MTVVRRLSVSAASPPRAEQQCLTANQLDEMMQLYPKTQIFDPSGYWTTERVKAAMKELGKDVPGWKKDVDSIEGRKVEAASQKRWQAVRDQDLVAELRGMDGEFSGVSFQ